MSTELGVWTKSELCTILCTQFTYIRSIAQLGHKSEIGIIQIYPKALNMIFWYSKVNNWEVEPRIESIARQF